jgi:hypothetical protein
VLGITVKGPFVSCIVGKLTQGARAMEKDDVELCEALVNWFESQQVGPMQAITCLAQLLGVMVGTASINIGDCVKGVVLAHETVLMTALNTMAAKFKSK